MKRLSIIIPVYNLEMYIERTLESCLSQDIDFSEYEIICVNDGSQDQSEWIIKKYQQRHSNIILYTQENLGVSVARNRGIKLASGRYIWFVDGDDLIASNCLSSLLSVLEENDIDVFGFHLQPVLDRNLFAAQVGKYELNENPQELMNFMSNVGGCGVCNEIFKAEIIKNNELAFNSAIKYSEDVLFSYMVLQKSRICAKTSSVLYHYYQRPGSAMHSQNYNKHIESMQLLAEEYRRLSDFDPTWRELSLQKKHFAVKALLFSTVQKGDILFAKEKIKELEYDGLYPFPFLWESLKNNVTRKQAIINYSSFLFPWKWYFMTCVRLVALKNKFKRKNK